ncbi:hypothetical protein NX794_03680 [Streptomyces sp. LP11]|uniref:Sigma-like protein n=1 Tax=Streptomyces pyxinicus TaxID=2970331 RepID=A0ABT2AVR6_9ACTN|nr:hypothetical protein [Streptomyces sp. LP11]MCS0600334.1 hypothetical protein [Streptomyces sp. LP11]
MSDAKKTNEVEAPATDVTTLNTHATSEPIKPVKLAAGEDGGVATPDNTHATDEKA